MSTSDVLVCSFLYSCGFVAVRENSSLNAEELQFLHTKMYANYCAKENALELGPAACIVAVDYVFNRRPIALSPKVRPRHILSQAFYKFT